MVECSEFRDLCMLLRESLNDKQIPRRHMLREGVLKQFKREFGQLKLELSVNIMISVSLKPKYYYFYSNLQEKLVWPPTCGPTKNCHLSWQSQPTGLPDTTGSWPSEQRWLVFIIWEGNTQVSELGMGFSRSPKGQVLVKRSVSQNFMILCLQF